MASSLTTAGAQFLAKAMTGLNSPTLFSASNYYISVGDSTTAFAIGQTDLQAATNKSRKLVSSVSEASGVITAVATWTTAEGNYDWAETGGHNASSGGTMAYRLVNSPSLGTKTSAQVWTLTHTVTFTAT